MEFERSESLRFNYHNIFFSYYFNNERSCTQMIHDHMLVYVYSGELVVEENNQRKEIHSGECVFLRRDNHVSMTKQPKNKEQFKAIFMIFSRNFLREFYQTLDKKSYHLKPTNTNRA